MKHKGNLGIVIFFITHKTISQTGSLGLKRCTLLLPWLSGLHA